MPSRRPATNSSRAIERVRTDSANSDCLILTKERRGGPPIIARQVIDGLKHDRLTRWVKIALILENPAAVPVRARAVHRGDVEGWLEPYSLADPSRSIGGNPPPPIISGTSLQQAVCPFFARGPRRNPPVRLRVSSRRVARKGATYEKQRNWGDRTGAA